MGSHSGWIWWQPVPSLVLRTGEKYDRRPSSEISLPASLCLLLPAPPSPVPGMHAQAHGENFSMNNSIFGVWEARRLEPCRRGAGTSMRAPREATGPLFVSAFSSSVGQRQNIRSILWDCTAGMQMLACDPSHSRRIGKVAPGMWWERGEAALRSRARKEPTDQTDDSTQGRACMPFVRRAPPGHVPTPIEERRISY
jgi:hypothetical protein